MLYFVKLLIPKKNIFVWKLVNWIGYERYYSWKGQWIVIKRSLKRNSRWLGRFFVCFMMSSVLAAFKLDVKEPIRRLTVVGLATTLNVTFKTAKIFKKLSTRIAIFLRLTCKLLNGNFSFYIICKFNLCIFRMPFIRLFTYAIDT